MPQAQEAPGGKASLKLDPRTYDRAQSCIGCGQCLSSCPTYVQTGLEAESPRGRIQIMRGLSDGNIDPTRSVREHLDSCLSCRACETACPSGVVYHEIIEETRHRLAKYDREKPPAYESYRGALKWFVKNVLTNPRRLKVTVAPIRVLQKTRVYPLLKKFRVMELLPAPMRKMEQLLPDAGPVWPKPLPSFTGAKGMDAVLVALQNAAINFAGSRSRTGKTTRKTVGFFAGCVGSVFYDRVNRMAIQILADCGVDVYAPPQQKCCGGVHRQGGDLDAARDLARANIDLFLPRDGTAVDFIVTNIGGCGSAMMEYELLLRDDLQYNTLAVEFRRRLRDISQMLLELTVPEVKYPVNLTAAYLDACPVAHGQRVTEGSRELLARIPGLTLVSVPDSQRCCGGAGAFSLEQSRIADDLANQKLDRLAEANVQVLITGNAGCASHLAAAAKQRGQTLRLVHPVELIHQSIFGPRENQIIDRNSQPSPTI